MRQTSADYKRIKAQVGSWYEVNVVVGNTVYGMDTLKSCKITQALFTKNAPTVGGTASAQCSLTLLEEKENWPRGGEFDVRVRVWDAAETEHSEWLTLGTFYTDERVQSGSTLEIYALDAMMRTEQSWIDKIPEEDFPTTWPITAKKAVDLICEVLDLTLDSRTELDDELAFVGLNEAITARDVLASCAAAMGGSFRITPEGKLLLVPLSYTGIDPGSAAIPGIAIAGITIIGDELPNTSGGETPEYVYVNPDQYYRLETGVPLPPVRGVEFSAQNGQTALAGSDYVLKGICDFSDSTVATLALTKVFGYVYKPFTVTRCSLDPAVEIGDVAYIGTVNYHIVSAVWKLGKYIFCDFEAPFEAEQEHEYPVQSETEKAFRKVEQDMTEADEELRSLISQTAGEITFEVSKKVGADEIISKINQSPEEITIAASKVNLSGYVTISSLGAGGTTVIDGSRIKTGTLDASAIKANTLSADYISGGTINAQSITVSNLNADNITRGTLGASRIGNLGASKITSGTFTDARIPDLDASKTTSGTFADARIPNLSADKITSGTIDAEKVTVKNIDASKITTGNLNATRISGGTLDCSNITVTNLSANSITSGTLNAENVTISNLTVNVLKFPSNATYNSGKTFILASTRSSELYIGGDNSTYNVDWINLHTAKGLYLKYRADTSGTYALIFDTTNKNIYPNTQSAWNIGTASKYFHYGYFNVVNTGSVGANIIQQSSSTNGLKIAASGNKLGFFGTSPVTKATVSGSTTDAKLTSLITALKNYGLISA